MKVKDEMKETITQLCKLVALSEDLTTLSYMIKDNYVNTEDSQKLDELFDEIKDVQENINNTVKRLNKLIH